jgi:hypothetical protein
MTLMPNADVDRLLIRIAKDYVDSDTLPVALLALATAYEHGNEYAVQRALRDLRALLAIDTPRPDDDEEDALVYRLCAKCHKLHAKPAECVVTT